MIDLEQLIREIKSVMKKADVSNNMDDLMDNLYDIVNALENEKYRQELEALSPFKEV